jgi:hypothetical protein
MSDAHGSVRDHNLFIQLWSPIGVTLVCQTAAVFQVTEQIVENVPRVQNSGKIKQVL